MTLSWDFPGGPVVKIPWGPSFNPWPGIPHATTKSLHAATERFPYATTKDPAHCNEDPACRN